VNHLGRHAVEHGVAVETAFGTGTVQEGQVEIRMAVEPYLSNARRQVDFSTNPLV
jgi:hypothetical protein